MLISLAWGVVTSLFPVLAVWNSFRLGTMPGRVQGFEHGAVRTTFF
ncbi:MAG: hypothetical protein R2941_22380 [Desulfobacterales bacterium]